MSKTIVISDEEIEAGKPDWLKRFEPDHPLHDLYVSSLHWRIEIFQAEGDLDAEARVQSFAEEWDIAKHTITLAEAKKRWGKSNLRQNPLHYPFRWQSEDGRGTWLTTTYAMEAAFGPEVDSDTTG